MYRCGSLETGALPCQERLNIETITGRGIFGNGLLNIGIMSVRRKNTKIRI